MTSSRVVRGSKGRILLGVFVIIAITVIIACFNNILNQLNETRKNYEQCHQQQENLSTQLQIIFDYKQRLEKSLKTEKAEHQQLKKELEGRIEDDQSNHEKSMNEINLKFSSLQQHYNILQAEYDDFKEESSKIQRQQLKEINDLQSKQKEIQGQFKQTINDKDKTLEHLKTQYLQIQIEKENLQTQLKGIQDGHKQAESDVNHLKKTNFELLTELQKKTANAETKPNDAEQAKLRIEETNNKLNEDSKNIENINILESQNQLGAPKLEKLDHEDSNNNNVLPVPNNEPFHNKKLSTPSSSVISKASLDIVQPIHIPNVSPSSAKTPSKQGESPILPLPYNPNKLPIGMPPVLDAHIDGHDESKPKVEEEKDVREDVNNALPNRYRANIILNEIASEDKLMEADKQAQKIENQNAVKVEVGDKENNAVEVFDPPLNNDGFGIDDAHLDIKRSQKNKIPGIHVEGVKLQGHNKAYDNGDYDKVPNDMQLEEEAEDDDPDYADHIARQKDPAVRN